MAKTISFPHHSLSLLLAHCPRWPRPNSAHTQSTFGQSRPAPPPSACSHYQVGSGGHPRPLAGPRATAESDRTRSRITRLLPWARTPRRPGTPIRLAATSYSNPFARNPSKHRAAAGLQTLGRRHLRSPRPPPLLQCGAAPEVCVKVRKPQGLLVDVLVPCAARRSSPECTDAPLSAPWSCTSPSSLGPPQKPSRCVRVVLS
jgi:hypothetical protein